MMRPLLGMIAMNMVHRNKRITRLVVEFLVTDDMNNPSIRKHDIYTSEIRTMTPIFPHCAAVKLTPSMRTMIRFRITAATSGMRRLTIFPFP
jgi:hypothetical protein